MNESEGKPIIRTKAGEAVCRLKHRLEVKGGPFRYVCCDSRECLFQKCVEGVRYCVYDGDEEGE